MNFEFPDVADHPENEVEVFPDHLIPGMPTFINQSHFHRDLNDLVKIIENFGDFNDGESTIFRKQIKRTYQAAELYFKKWRYPGPSELTENGVVGLAVNTDYLFDFFRGDIERLMAQPDNENLDIMEVDRATCRVDAGALKVVDDLLTSRGLMDEVRKYAGRPLRVVQVTVHVSRPSDQHIWQTFRDCETRTKLFNLHIDPKPGTMKAIIYLSEVTGEDGPFSVIRGSHRWEVDEIERIFAWGNSTGNYCHTPPHRRVACAFPRRFRKSAIVGGLIPDGSDLSDFLLANLTRYISDVATVMVFDPAFLMHHGGNPSEGGERVNLQVGMK